MAQVLLRFLDQFQQESSMLYLDPGTGSFMAQSVIAALVAGLFLVRRKFALIATYFRSKQK